MTEQLTRARAECEECGKVYRVPDADRSYTCKECGGAVLVPDDEEEDEPQVEDTAEARHDATVALQTVFSRLSGLNWFYGLASIACAVGALFAMLGLAGPEKPLTGGVIVASVMTLLCAITFVAAVKLHFHPYTWALVVAVAATVVTLAQFASPDPFGVPFFISAAIALLGWAALKPMAGVRDVIDDHEDQYILHHANTRLRRTLKSRGGEDQHDRLLDFMDQASSKAWRKAAVGAVIIAAGGAAGTYMVVEKMRPQDLSPSVAGFEAAWNASNLEAVTAMFDERYRAPQSERLAGLVSGHGWDAALPRLADGQTREENDATWVDYDVADLTVSACWVLDRPTWILVSVELPNPPFEATFQEFQAAWRSSDAAALVSYFPEEHRQKMQDYVVKAALGRGWETYPDIAGVNIGEYVDDQVIATLNIDGKDLTSKWHIRRDGSWGLHALLMPPK